MAKQLNKSFNGERLERATAIVGRQVSITLKVYQHNETPGFSGFIIRVFRMLRKVIKCRFLKVNQTPHLGLDFIVTSVQVV